VCNGSEEEKLKKELKAMHILNTANNSKPSRSNQKQVDKLYKYSGPYMRTAPLLGQDLSGHDGMFDTPNEVITGGPCSAGVLA
jgi:hypothetical protein